MRKSLLFLLLLVACTKTSAQPSNHPWGEALRALDPANASTPANDITAVYLHQQDEFLQVRVDLLDFENPNDLSLEIWIEDNAAPQKPPLIIKIPSHPDSYRISLDPVLTTVIVDIPLSKIPPQPLVNVSSPEDQITGLRLDGQIPNQIAPLLLTFFDTFAGRFPAEALRSWDGAHSSPRGERHGLKHLLDAVEEYQAPIVLLDLDTPENISALDAMGIQPHIQSLADQELLYLPENDEDDIQFVYLEEVTHPYHPIFGNITYFPIPTETNINQPTPDGPTLAIRRKLLDITLNGDDKDLLVLGGSLTDTTWGSPDMVGETMAYFTSRPYIKILNYEDLLLFPTQIVNSILPQPSPPTAERALQILSIMDYANSWAISSEFAPIYHCQTHSEEITLPDRILANISYLAIFDSKGSELTFLFTRDETGLHQLVGPSWQVAPGIDIYPGAFADDKAYKPNIIENALVFESTDGTQTKTFTLTESGLEVEYQTQEPKTTQIPLLVDPETRLTPNWTKKYIQKQTPDGIVWGLENGLMVNIQFDGDITFHAFNESLSLLSSPEDPNFGYPPGHFVPFPMAIVEMEMKDGYFLRLGRLGAP